MDLAKALGATGRTSIQCLTLYIPSCDKVGKPLDDQRRWVALAARLLAEIGGGVTIMPPVEGGWVADDGEIVWERPVLVYTFIRPTEMRRSMVKLRRFLHSMGRHTNQGEVAVEFDGDFYRIRTFDRVGPPVFK